MAWGEGGGAWMTLALGVHMLLSPITVVAFASHLALFLQRSLSLPSTANPQLRPFRLGRLFFFIFKGCSRASRHRAQGESESFH